MGFIFCFCSPWRGGGEQSPDHSRICLDWLEALVITLAAVLGSALAALLLWRHIRNSKRESMRSSVVIVSFFALGVLLGYLGVIPLSLIDNDMSFYALCCLMFFVGVSLGNDSNTLKRFASLNPRLYLLPVATVVGTLLGCAIVSLLLPGRSVFDTMAIGSGFGYYSLSSIFITEYKGAELGTIALLSNIIR